MQPEARELADHMRHLGLTMLAHAIHHSIFSDIENPYYNAIGVLHAAQAGEVILKACIATEHPLLIFAKLPKPEKERELSLERLIKHGRTLQYADLPDVFWAATGFHVPAVKVYREFGELRNLIQHLAVPQDNLSDRTLKFLIHVVDPLIQEFWATNIFQHLQTDEHDYFMDALDEHDIVYEGWVPGSRSSLDTRHPLWLFEPWEHSLTKERVWVDDHLDEVKILKAADYDRYLASGTAPIEWLSGWRTIFPSVRGI